MTARADELYLESRFPEAYSLYTEALQVYEAVLDEDDPIIAGGLRRLANVYFVQQRYRKAERLYRRAAAIYERNQHLSLLAEVLTWVGKSAFERRKYKRAEAAYRRSLTVIETLHGPDSPEAADGLMTLGFLCYFVGRYSEAEPLFLRALEIRDGCLEPNDPVIAHCTGRLAILYRNARELRGNPEPFYVRTLAIREATGKGPKLLEAIYRLADFYSEHGRHEEADPLLRRWLELLGTLRGNEDNSGRWERGTSWMRSGYLRYLRRTGRGAEAAALDTRWGEYDWYEDFLQTRLRHAGRASGPDHPKVATVLLNIGRHRQAQEGGSSEAEELYRRALGIRERAFGPDDASVAEALYRAAARLSECGRHEAARPLIEEALALAKCDGVWVDELERADYLSVYADVLRAFGEVAEADCLAAESAAIWDAWSEQKKQRESS